MFKRVLCLFAAFTVLFCCSCPAFATGMTPGGVGGGVAGIPVVGEVQLDVVDFSRYCDDKIRGYGNFIWNLIDNDVCSHAPQFGGSHRFSPRRTQVDGQIGTYYVCDYCGRASGEVLEEAYSEYVAENIGDGLQYVNQGGTAGISGDWEFYDFSAYRREASTGRGMGNYTSSEMAGLYFFNGNELLVNTSDTFSPFSVYIRVTVPCRSILHYDFAVSDNGRSLGNVSGAQSFSEPTVFSVSRGNLSSSAVDGLHRILVRACNCYFELLDSADVSNAIDFRVGSGDNGVSGLYGYVDDGQLYQSTTRDIFNETTNTYNNPVTGDTYSVESWTYDYSDRSYNLTTDEGDTVTVTYGDTNVTINDGGTTYNVYYLTEHDESVPEHHYTSSVTLAPTCTGTGVRTYACDECGETYTETIPATGHDYQSVVTMSPSCINTGVRTFTCSVCGDVYTVSIPATGHSWQVLQTVPMVYDEGGQLVTEGYTLYQCATCGEQYKITSDSGGTSLPAPSTGGTSIDTGSTNIELDPHVGRGFLATIAHGLTEDLPEVLKAASAWFTEFPAFYSGFTLFLKDGIVGCLPDIVRKTMGFGLSMVTFVGVVRKIIGR